MSKCVLCNCLIQTMLIFKRNSKFPSPCANASVEKTLTLFCRRWEHLQGKELTWILGLGSTLTNQMRSKLTSLLRNFCANPRHGERSEKAQEELKRSTEQSLISKTLGKRARYIGYA